MNTKGSDTLLCCVRKAGMHRAFIYLFFGRAKILRILASHIFLDSRIYHGNSCWIRPAGRDIMTNLQKNTVGLKFLDFNRVLIET